MANEPTEPRALSAALSAPSPFTPRVGGSALHAANRHVERWAPEATSGSGSAFRPMRSLGFVDRLIAPWIETAQRSASLRVFSHYSTVGTSEREGAAVSWVFPRPWYQDELDWMAAARRTQAEQARGESAAPTMFTTRGTFVAPAQQAPAALPTSLYEYVAPSLSLAQPAQQPAGVGYGGGREAYSPLVSLAAVQAADLMSRAVAPLVRTPQGASGPTVGRVSPQLRTVLTAMLERAGMATIETRAAQRAPELVTPPAPRPEQPLLGATEGAPAASIAESPMASSASQLAAQYAEQRARIVELQRVARVSAEREIAVRLQAQAAEKQVSARAAEQRIAEEQQRAQAAQPGPAQPAQDAERLRIEERVAQRIAERAAQAESQARAQQAEVQARAEKATRAATPATPARLHEQARAEAAQHARSLEMPVPTTAPQVAAAPPVAPYVTPPEVAAAIAALPPELQQMISARPERGLAAITQVAETLRTAELLARSAAANQTFQATRGPRLVMPAGIGGLVSAVERAHVVPSPIAAVPAPIAGVARPMAPSLPLIAPRTEPARVPTLPWLAGAAPAAPSAMGRTAAPTGAFAPTTALGATTSSTPAALSHVAWSDRWLARFAGANPRSLDILQAGSGASPEQRLQALAAAAPESIFVRPIFDIDTAPASQLRAPAFEPTLAAAPGASAPSLVPTPVLRPAPQRIERYDDEAETPDSVFAQIAAAAAGVRTRDVAPPAAGARAVAPQAAQPAAELPATARMSTADAIAHAAPSAPGAGLSATLSASPFAPSLRHLLPMPSSATFDVRALFGTGLSATYLAGLLAPSAEEIVVSGIAAPAWAQFQTASGVAAAQATERMAPELDLAYVAPESERPVLAPAAGDEAASIPSPSAVVSAPDEVAALAAAIVATGAPMTTLRTALLSWAVDPAAPSLSAAPTVTPALATALAEPASAARAVSQSMSMPMLGEPTAAIEAGSSWAAPGMVAERAHHWSVSQERSASDLSFDFVPPELVLAARVYGLGPAEAAQAARLAVAGPTQLAAMASTVDRAFVQAMTIATERRESVRPGAQAITTAYPMPVISAPATTAPATTAPTTAAATAAASIAAASAAASATTVSTAASSIPSAPELAPAMPSSAFGVERRAPRGAFLWPSATVAALGLSAQAPEGVQAVSVAALELLAAQAVAEIGTYAALSEQPVSGAVEQIAGETGVAPAGGLAARPSVAAPPATPATSADRAAASPVIAEPAEADVLGAAAAMVPSSRRARFDALYIALSQSPSGRSWSPAARAARALALAGRSDDAPTSAYERAATAWDVLPVVYATDGMTVAEIEAATAAGTLPALARAARRAHGLASPSSAPEMTSLAGDVGRVDRPGLGPAISRAGEVLGSYVAPSTGELATAASRGEPVIREIYREVPISQRAPTAAAELVRTGQSYARYGGGEVEIPAWFEAAAKKMFEEKTGAASSSVDGGFSLAELTLVNAAPAAHIAASSKVPHAAAAGTPASAAAGASPDKGKDAVDVDQLATDLYQQILAMMDIARSRNGEPYL